MKFISKMKKIILIGFFFLTNLYIIKGQGLTVDKIIGIVGDKIILFSDLEIQYRQYLSQGLEGNEDLKCKMLDQMFKEKMLPKIISGEVSHIGLLEVLLEVLFF